MKGEIVWQDSPSQILNMDSWLISIIAGVFLFFATPRAAEYLPAFTHSYFYIIKWAAPLYITTHLAWAIASIHVRSYTMSVGEIIEKRGVFNQTVGTTELFRVKDVTVEKPFFLRMFNQGNIILHTSDHSTPIIFLEAIDRPEVIMSKIRELVLASRKKAGVREFD